MNEKLFEGVYGIVLTPFCSDGKVDFNLGRSNTGNNKGFVDVNSTTDGINDS